jgi:hypothetical protein
MLVDRLIFGNRVRYLHLKGVHQNRSVRTSVLTHAWFPDIYQVNPKTQNPTIINGIQECDLCVLSVPMQLLL